VILRVLSLFIRYGDSDYKGAYRALMDFYARMPGVKVESVLIDTALPAGVVAWIGPRGRMLAGDNQRREFSGWDTAIARYRARLGEFDLVHLVTSAFQNEYNGFYPLVCREMLDYVHRTPGVMLAHVDAYPEPARLLGRSFQTWGCSKFLFARPADLLALGTLTGPFAGTDFFPEDGGDPFRADAPLSANYSRFLLDWLTGDGLPHGKWHSVFRYSAENIAKFRAKALSILDEHSLSMRIRESGVQIVDYTWWHANKHQVWNVQPPDELVQVQERNRFLFGNPIVEGQVQAQKPFDSRPELDAILVSDTGEGMFVGPLVDALISGMALENEEGGIHPACIRAGSLMKAGYAFTAHELAWLQIKSPDLLQDTPVPITYGLHAAWLSRSDLRQALDLTTAEGRRGLVGWWMNARRDDASLLGLVAADVLAESDPSLTQDAPLPLSRGLHAEWLSRPDLHQALDLTTAEGRRGLVGWWVSNRRADSHLRALLTDSVLSELAPGIPQDAVLPITRGLRSVWLARDDLQQAFSLDVQAGRQAMGCWWLAEKNHDPFVNACISAGLLAEPVPVLPQDASAPIRREDYLLWLMRDDLRAAFDLTHAPGRQAFVEWLASYGVEEKVAATTRLVVQGQEQAAAECSERGYAANGVNIIGYGRGEFGIGEDVRMAIRALRTTELDFCTPRLELSLAARQDDLTVRRYEVPSPLYRTNLICLPHYETLRLLAATRKRVLDRRYNIGFWQWELPRFPDRMKCALDLVDEIWSSSSFTTQAMQAVSHKPVMHMPMVVELPAVRSVWVRRDFNLREDEFVFLTVLDGNSSLRRKNPLATVRAFTAAFGADLPVRLVVKAMNVSASHPEWKAVTELAAGDSRITLVLETMPKDMLLGLQSVCDCFVSLHRAEGFGRNIAEAMALGKPVVVSDFSGNLDFTTEETAFLVAGSTQPLLAGDYAFGDGQSWFEPCQEAAVEALRQVFSQTDLRLSKAQAGKRMIEINYSAQVVGAGYFKRLSDLGLT
jgi:glycosyltransferase involved in cell wall biosynthesis